MGEETTYSPLTMKEGEICYELQCSRTHLWRLVKRGDFPEPCIKRPRFVRWNRMQVKNWMLGATAQQD